MTKPSRPHLAIKLAISAAVVGIAFVLRGLAPEMYRYLRIRRM